MKLFREIFSSKKPSTAREFMGYPVRMEEFEVSTGTACVMDNTVMRDGRPAYAWWNEIQMLRQQGSDNQKLDIWYREQMIRLRIFEWAVLVNPEGSDLLIRFRRDLAFSMTEYELAEKIGKLCTFEPGSGRAGSGE